MRAAARYTGRLRRLERAVVVAAPDGDVPLAPIRLTELGALVKAEELAEETGDPGVLEVERRRLARELRRRYLVGGRSEWPEIDVFLELRDWLAQAGR